MPVEIAQELVQQDFSSKVEGKCLKFEKIGYSVRCTDPKKSIEESEATEKQVLKDVTGIVEGGTMMCCLGPSGSGKTSLIHIISGRIKSTANKSHTVQGAITVDDAFLTSTQFQRISGLVTQEDVFESSLTVGETISFTAALKIRREFCKQRIEAVISALQLESCRNTHIGDDANPYLKGVSGGEKRRTAIAMEILDPSISILVLDEPTSGLDAAAAQNVVNVLRSLADEQNKAILMTLHQPRSSIMRKFESVMVLAEGEMIYNGAREEFPTYMDGTLQCTVPLHENPYDVMLDVLNPAISKDESVPALGRLGNDFDGNVPEELSKIFLGSNIYATLIRKASTAVVSEQTLFDSENSCNATNWISQFIVLLHRTFVVKLRDPICLMTQISSGILMGLIFGALYWSTYDKSTTSFAILDTQMCIVMVTLMAVWLPYDVTLTFPTERRIFMRERRAGLYPTSAFYTARILADVPAHIVSAVIMGIIVHLMADLKCDMGGFILIMIAAILVGAAILQCIGAMSRTFEEANIYMMVVLMMSMMLGTGFVREVPSFLDWARDISVMGIVADMAMYLEFKDVKPKYGTSKEIFDEYGVLITNDEELWDGAQTLFWILVVCRILCFLFVKFLFTGRTFAEDLRD